MIDASIYAAYMTAIADRLRFPLADATSALYYITLSKSLTTEQFQEAAEKVFAEYDDFGFPPPAVFLASIQGPPVVDGASILRQISKLGHPAPHGYLYPNAGQVRDAMGDMIGDAYASAGGSPRCFADDETTSGIAARDFQKALETYAAHPDKARPLIASPAEARKLTARNAPAESIANVVTRALPPLVAEAAAQSLAHPGAA